MLRLLCHRLRRRRWLLLLHLRLHRHGGWKEPKLLLLLLLLLLKECHLLLEGSHLLRIKHGGLFGHEDTRSNTHCIARLFLLLLRY